MPHASVKLKPGIDQNETPALNEAGISFSNLIRFIYDRDGLGLIQKLGGWTKFYPNTIESIIRALWAWEDTNSNSHLAVGTQNNTNTNVANLSVITNGLRDNITPQTLTDDLTLGFSTTAGSPVVTITDTINQDISDFDSVYIQVQVAVGGLILFGNYRTFAVSNTTYNIIATDLLGAPQAATSTSVLPVLPNLSVTSGSAIVTITLANHGYVVGDTFPILASTVVGGATFYGNYIVQEVITSSQFTVISTALPTSTTTGYVNANQDRVTYNFGAAPGAVGYGYGGNGYGTGGYGTGVSPASLSGSEVTAFDWTLDNWGEVLIACPRNDTLYQPIYEWNPTSGIPIASVIPQAPTVNDGVFVAMPQRQIIAWGSTFTGIQDPLLIRWCDVNNYNSWIGTVTNQAGSYRIPKGSKIVGCIQGPQQALVWTDLGVWAMQYVGPPFVYSFNEIGTGCGLIAKKAAASISGSVYWMGPSQFFKLSGEGVAPVACPIWDVIFQDLDQTNLDKIRVAVNSRFGEITWYYPTESNGGEVNAYAKYNVYLQQWDYGTLARSAWIDQSVLGPPIGADPDSLYIYQHETSTDADGQPLLASFQTGYFTMSNADVKMFVDQVWPDMKWGYFGGTQNATVNLTFFTTDYPGQTPQQFGPYPLTQSTTFISPRFRGRLVSIRLDSTDVGSFWRIGNIRYRTKEDGKF